MKKRAAVILDIPQLKREARRIQSDHECGYSKALDLVAQKHEYQNWSLLAKHNPEAGISDGSLGAPAERMFETVNRVYSEAARFFEASASPLTRPVSQNGKSGFAILYTTPRYRPDLLIIGQNPGNFGPSSPIWDDDDNRIMMSGHVPTFNSYIAHKHKFGCKLQEYFSGPNNRLLKHCVGMNIWFFQAKGTPEPPLHLAEFCEKGAESIIEAVDPKVILCLSKKAFDTLRSNGAVVIARVAISGTQSIEIRTSSFQGIPMACADHPTGRPHLKAKTTIPAAIAWVNSQIGRMQPDWSKGGEPDKESLTTTSSTTGKEKRMDAQAPFWNEKFDPQVFSTAQEAGKYILDQTNGAASDRDLNNFVLSWAGAAGKSLKNTPKQNRNRVNKFRRSWKKHGHCADMSA